MIGFINRGCVLLLLVTMTSHGERSDAADWPQFRGPDGNSFVSVRRHPGEWSSGKNIGWKTEIPGGGWSSPVVAGDRVFVTTAVAGGKLRPKGFSEGVSSMRRFFRDARKPIGKISYEVHCLRLSDGRRIWKKQVVQAQPPHRVHPSNSYATESPVVVGQRVCAYFATIGVVACLDTDGKEIWRRDVGAYSTSSSFGTGSSLASARGKVFLQCDNQQKSFLLAMDAENGKKIWRVDRLSRTCWSSPLVWKNRLRTELVVCGSGDVAGYDLETGKVLWRLRGLGGSFSSSPASDENRIYIGNSGPGRSGPLVAVNAGAAGELSLQDSGPDSGIAWVQQKSGPGLASPVSDGRMVYVTSRGILNAYDAGTGSRVYRTRLKGVSNVAASPWVAGDQLFVLGERGTTSVIHTGKTFQLVRSNSVKGLFWSTPSVAGPDLLLRSADSVYCIRPVVGSSGSD